MTACEAFMLGGASMWNAGTVHGTEHSPKSAVTNILIDSIANCLLLITYVSIYDQRNHYQEWYTSTVHSFFAR